MFVHGSKCVGCHTVTKLACFVTGLSCHGGAYLPGSHQIKQNVPFTVGEQ